MEGGSEEWDQMEGFYRRRVDARKFNISKRKGLFQAPPLSRGQAGVLSGR